MLSAKVSPLLLLLAFVMLALQHQTAHATAEFSSRTSALRARARQEAADRLRRGFRNSALATARGFGKRSGGEMTMRALDEGEEAMEPARGKSLAQALHSREGMRQLAELVGGDTREGARRMEEMTDERYPVSMVSDLVTSSPSLVTTLVSRFLDTDQDGYITPQELLKMM